jgi:DNA-binding MarR family transcriptional regulator
MDEIDLVGAIFLARRRRYSELLRAFEITLPQLHLIQLARRKGPISPSVAADELDCDRPTATLIAQKCVAQGWLTRHRSEHDRRSARLELSGEGEELLDRIEKARIFSSASVGDPLDVLGNEERTSLKASLEKAGARARELFGGRPSRIV